ncbi:MAG: VF530 family protein [Spirochaetales bacterium]|nr:VF530 family protein [Spirochaetales bacterium]
MSEEQPNNPLHGLTLEAILTRLVKHYQWEGLAARIRVRCFSSDPSIKSSLTFLRKTPWARIKVETLYLRTNFALPARPFNKTARGSRASNPSASTRAAASRAVYPAKAPHAPKAPRRDTRELKTDDPGTQGNRKQKSGV